MRFPLNKNADVSADATSFAALDLTISTEIPVGATHPGAFAVERRHHVHEGVDLYALENDPVFAMEAGVVVSKGPFTGPAAGFPWWLDTEFVMVEGASGVLCYGEIRVNPSLALGEELREGDLLGWVATVLAMDKGRPRNMLHIERYSAGVRESCGVWEKNSPKPTALLDPTPLLLQACLPVS